MPELGRKKNRSIIIKKRAKKRAKKQIRRKTKGSVFTAEKKATILETVQRKIKGRIKKNQDMQLWLQMTPQMIAIIVLICK